jgi:hypothetical protein
VPIGPVAKAITVMEKLVPEVPGEPLSNSVSMYWLDCRRQSLQHERHGRSGRVRTL